MKRQVDINRIARELGARQLGRQEAKGGYFGALQLVADVRARFKTPKGGGRATDPKWTAPNPAPCRGDLGAARAAGEACCGGRERPCRADAGGRDHPGTRARSHDRRGCQPAHPSIDTGVVAGAVFRGAAPPPGPPAPRRRPRHRSSSGSAGSRRCAPPGRCGINEDLCSPAGRISRRKCWFVLSVRL